jgi:hypothetical protein
MDLYAYASITNLEPLLELNGVNDIKRLRGLRLMGLEKPIPEKEIKQSIRSNLKYSLESLFAYDPKIGCWCYDDRADFLAWYYLKGDGSPRWDKIHGKLRKAVKFEIKKNERKVRKNLELFNKYAGREDVLYIHTRTGGGNWNYFGCGSYLKEPWYLDHCDDYFDSTYCDIYVKIDPETLKQLPEEPENIEEETNEE